MDLSLWCVLIAAFLPILAVMPGKLSKDYDNARPRDPGYWSDGFRARAAGAMANSYEAFPVFAAAVIIARMEGGAPGVIDALAGAYILSRLGYIVCYWIDRDRLRSAIWVLGVALVVALFTTPLWSPVAAS